MPHLRFIFRIELLPFNRLDAHGRHLVLRAFCTVLRTLLEPIVHRRCREVKAGEEMPRQNSFTSHNWKQGLATGTHQSNDLTVTQMQSLHIVRMHS